MLVTDIGYALAGLTAPCASRAAAGFGIAVWHDGGKADPYLSVKGVRDIASGLIAVILLAARMPTSWAGSSWKPAHPDRRRHHRVAQQRPEGHRLRRARRDGRSVAGHRRAPIRLTT